MPEMLLALWRYRGFVLSSITSEFKSRFARSTLGGLWMLIQPLSQVLIYALILSAVLGAKLPGIDNRYAYAIYLTAGFIAWTLFNEIVSRCLSLFIDHANNIKKMQFPKVTLPAIVVGSSLLNNLALIFSALLIFGALGHNPGPAVLWLPLLTALVIGLDLGAGLICGVLNVFIRDMGQAVPIVLQIVFWCTPIVYPLHIVPAFMQNLLRFNPLLPLVNSYQQVLLYQGHPKPGSLLFIGLTGFALLGLGLFIFRRAVGEMADAL